MKNKKAISLIVLVITILVLSILATVAIISVANVEVLGKAKDATNKYNQAVAKEQEELDSSFELLSAGDPATTFAEATDKSMLVKTVNSTVYDEYGNKIVVPAGFKIVVNADTNNAEKVTEGIVIEDGTGNQFVWIPVGKIYTDKARTEENAKTITLGRYSNFSATNGVYTPAQTAENYATATSIGGYTEDTSSNHSSSKENSIARNIGDFVTSATSNGGYYLGRYEARTNNTTGRSVGTAPLTTVTSIKANAVYNYVTQEQASSLSQGMYADGYKNDGTGTFSSDLVNGYAWDTAIIFVQTFDDRENNTTLYAAQASLNNSFSPTGTTVDVICNIYDMASNYYEFSTETSSKSDAPCVSRGGCAAYLPHMTYSRYWRSTSLSYSYYAFRPVLYVGI